MGKYLMALDQGTTSSRCIIFDKACTIKSSTHMAVRQIYPKPGWVEQDPMEILSSLMAVLVEAKARGGVDTADLSCVGLTNQRETTIVWDKRNGKPVYNAIIWQCRRIADYCERLKKDGMESVIRAKTGLPVDAYFSATKIIWLLDNVDGVRADAEAGHLLFGTVDSWLLWNLTQGRVHATDYSNASRTMLFNIHTLAWDEKLLRAMNIPRVMLPEVKPSSHVYGYASAETTVHDIPLAGIAGDQQAALFGQCCHAPGSVKNTYGTGCFILMNTGTHAITSSHDLLTTMAWGCEGKISYALEGSIFITGAAVQWLHEGLRLLDTPSLAEAYANKVPDPRASMSSRPSPGWEHRIGISMRADW